MTHDKVNISDACPDTKKSQAQKPDRKYYEKPSILSTVKFKNSVKKMDIHDQFAC